MAAFDFKCSLFARFVLRDIRRNMLRTVLTVCGIALGVAVFLAISIANDTALSRFRQTVGQVAGAANLELIPLSGVSIDQDLMRELSVLERAGVKYTPVIDENIVVKADISSETPGELVQVLGIDMLADGDFKRYENTEVDESKEEKITAGKGLDSESDRDRSVFAPQSVLVGGALAQRLHLKAGSALSVLLPGGPYPLTVAGILSTRGLGGAYSGNLLVADLGLAQEMTGLTGRFSRVDMIVPPEALAAVTDKLRSTVGADVMVAAPEARSEQASKMTRSFEYNLLALTLIALMVGMFLIYNTMTITVLRRRPDIGVLRALGVGRATIFEMFLWEALLLGSAGTALGVALGGVMAQGALRAVAQTFQYFYFKVPLEQVVIPVEQILLASAIGIGLTLLAALPPLIESTTVAASEATRRASIESRVRGFSPVLFALGLGAFAAAYVSSLQGPLGNFPVFGYLAAFFSIVGAALTMPLFLQMVLPFISSVFSRLFGAGGRIAAATLQGTLSRTAVASASLMIGIAMMLSLAIMISSFRGTVTQWIDQSFQADLWMQSQARAAGNKLAKLPESILSAIGTVDGVAAVEGFVDRRVDYKGLPIIMAAADFDILAQYGNQLFTSGRSNKDVCTAMKGKRCIVSEPLAVRNGLKSGDRIEIGVEGGTTELEVVDVFYDYASDAGYVIISRDVYKELYREDKLSNVAVYLKPGADLEKVRKDIVSRCKDFRLAVNSTRELRREAITIFDRTFAITYALHTIAVVVSMLSVMNALFALTIESKRDFAILRYIGAGRGLLSRVVYLQAAVLAVVGNITGLGLGYILSLLLTHVINKQSFGWSVQYAIPWDFIWQSTLLVTVTAVASAAVPARMAAKTVAPAVIREE